MSKDKCQPAQVTLKPPDPRLSTHVHWQVPWGIPFGTQVERKQPLFYLP